MSNDQKTLGTCQACFQWFAMTQNNVMVHHGFTRPGDGVIIGDCPGVGKGPYQLSCDYIKKAHHTLTTHSLPIALQDLQTLETATEVTFLRMGHYPTRKIVAYTFTQGVEVPSTHFIIATTFYTAKQQRIGEAKCHINSAESQIKICAARIEAWKYAPESLKTEARSAPKAKTVHMQHTANPRQSACVSMRHNLALTTDRAAVTCAKCQTK